MSIELFILFFAIALAYSSVGFGGGSSYLAFLSLLLTDFYEIRTLGLILNLVVVSLGTIAHYRRGFVDIKSFWPFIILSIVFAFLGARFQLSETSFFMILGASLLLSSFFMFLQSIKRKSEEKQLNIAASMGLGSGLGFLSGLVGIGGGIFLSPTLNLIGWKNPRYVAALASVYILFNSASGLSGLITSDNLVINWSFAIPLIAAVFFGGIIGSNLSASKLNIHLIRALTGMLVAYVGLRLILFHGFGINI